jgi:hypothetical protein
VKEYPTTEFSWSIGLGSNVVLLQELIEAGSIAVDGFIFLTEAGNHISRSVYNKARKQALARVGLADVRPYDLRASNISWTHAGGVLSDPQSSRGQATSVSALRGLRRSSPRTPTSARPCSTTRGPEAVQDDVTSAPRPAWASPNPVHHR